MKTLSRDTPPEIEAVLIEKYRAMSSVEKSQILRGLMRSTRAAALRNVRRRYPDACERELLLRAAALTMDRRDMIRAFDWDPEQMGL